MIKWRTILVLILIVFMSCMQQIKISGMINNTSNNNILDSLLNENPEYFRNILNRKDSLHLQIIYTQINRNAENVPHFDTYTFNVDDDAYYYPASTVKLPVALLALEKINSLKNKGLNKYTKMIFDISAASDVLPHEYLETLSEQPQSVADCIEKIFLVSDNDAYNRLYEFLGQEYINKALKSKGYNAEIRHRLNFFMSKEQNAYSAPLKFLNDKGETVYEQPAQKSNYNFPEHSAFIGKAYYKDSTLIHESFNFSAKNKLSLTDLTNVLRSVMFPQSASNKQKFNLSEDDYRFLYKYMSAYPNETELKYDTTEFYPLYSKLLFYGSDKNTKPTSYVRIFNKEGDAYGFLTDAAYIADFKHEIEFMLSATIYCNSDEILNDEHYDYDSVGLPFLKHLGETLYNYELKRQRKNKPDLSKFLINYDQQ